MFNKSADPTAAPATARSGGAVSNTRSILASDLKITGEITSTGSVEVLGEIDGNLTARGLVIGAEGRISGTVRAETIEVKGRLDGKVDARDFTLRAAAQVAADVTYGTVVIESGASIEGRFAKARG